MSTASVLLCALALGGCAEILSALAASTLTGWLTNRDHCTVQQTLIEGKIVAETRVCTETSIFPKGLFGASPPLPVPTGSSPTTSVPPPDTR